MRKQLIIFLVLIFSVLQTKAQVMSYPFQIEVGLGSSMYHGDLTLGTKGLKAEFALNIGLKYYLSNQLAFIPRLGLSKLSGNDALGDNTLRNLSFETDLYYLSMNFSYNFYKNTYRSPRKIWPYAIVGLGASSFNPKAELEGEMLALQPLQTEGIAYSRVTLIIPVGVGVRYKVQEGIELGIEYSWSYTFTDYLDDVSTSYVDVNSLQGNAFLLADRTNEVGIPTETVDQVHWSEGAKRGKSTFNDSFSNLTFSIKLDIYKSSRGS